MAEPDESIVTVMTMTTLALLAISASPATGTHNSINNDLTSRDTATSVEAAEDKLRPRRSPSSRRPGQDCGLWRPLACKHTTHPESRPADCEEYQVAKHFTTPVR